MNTEREVGGSRGFFNSLVRITYFPDGRVPLKAGRFKDVILGNIDYFEYPEGIFFRRGDGRGAINHLNNKLGDGDIIPVWTYFSFRGRFKAGSEGISQPLVTYDPSSGELSFTNNEDWIRVRGYLIEGYDGKNY